MAATAVFLWLAFVGFCFGSHVKVIEDSQNYKPFESQLSERVDRLERLLSDVGARLQSEEARNAHQNQVIARQETKLAQQDAKIARQEKLVKKQASKLAKQDRLLALQAKVINQLKTKSTDNSRKLDSTEIERDIVRPHKLNDMAMDQSVKDKKTRISADFDTPRPQEAHDVMARSDDAGPLEGVVSQLSQQMTQMTADVQTLKTSDTQQDQNIQDARTSTFVRWGSSHCGSHADLVYSGIVGGSLYTNPGAATNYLCLTMSPVFSSRSLPNSVAMLYGGEYETETHADHTETDPVCAVCRSAYSTTVMVPGTNTCTAGWHLQYSGYLMAGFHGHPAGSEFICVDSSLESTAHSEANQNGKLLYFTVTHCGSLPCSPYEANKVVTCAVCSK